MRLSRIPNTLVDVKANTFNSVLHYGRGHTTFEYEIRQN